MRALRREYRVARAAARHRAAADDPAGRGSSRAVVFGVLTWPEALVLAIVLAPTDAALGQAVVTDPRLPVTHPPGPERRERPQRRHLRAAALHRARAGRGRAPTRARHCRRSPGRRGDRLRASSAGSSPARVAALHPRARHGSDLVADRVGRSSSRSAARGRWRTASPHALGGSGLHRRVRRRRSSSASSRPAERPARSPT